MDNQPTDYENFSLDDFVIDPFFREWVLFPEIIHEEFWSDWKKANPSKINLVEEARDMVLNLEKSKLEMSPEELLSVWDAIQADIKKPVKTIESSTRNSKFWSYFAAVASVVLVCIGWYWYELPKEIEYQTAFGQTREIMLPDSSTVILNSNSKLTFVNDWEDQRAREIWIEGEAFFSVVHKIDHQPFKVLSSQNVAIEVLGTEFNVYNRSGETEVILNSGLVTLSFPVKEKEGKIVMEPGDLVKFKDNKFQRTKVNTSLYTSWKDNILNLEHTSLAEMVKMAKDNYGVTIEVQNKEALNLTASGSMPLTNADAFLHQIALIFNVELTKENNKYLIK